MFGSTRFNIFEEGLLIFEEGLLTFEEGLLSFSHCNSDCLILTLPSYWVDSIAGVNILGGEIGIYLL